MGWFCTGLVHPWFTFVDSEHLKIKVFFFFFIRLDFMWNYAQMIIFVNRGPIGLDDLYRLKKIVNWNFGFDLRWNARFPSDRFEKRPISTPDVPVNRVNRHQIGKSIFFGKSVEPPDLTRIYDWPRKKVELKTSASMYLPIQNLSTPCTSQQPLYHRNAPRFQ